MMQVDRPVPLGMLSPTSVLQPETLATPYSAVDVALLLSGPLRAEVDAHCQSSARDRDGSNSTAAQLASATSQNTDITPRMRATLCGWMVEVSQEFKLHQETLFIAFHLTDRFLARQPEVTKQQLQMVGTACLFIAAKQEEETFPGLTAFSEIANNSFTPHDLARLEVRILITLEHRIASPTPCVFLSYLVHGLGLNRKAAALASYLLELSVVENCTVKQPPSTAAIAAAVIAGCVSDPVSIQSLVKGMRGCVPEALQNCVVMLVQLYDRAYYEEDTLHYFHVLKEKYDDPINENVSCAIIPTAMEECVINSWMSLVHKRDT
mmetsp:Transcript_32097/g.83157  ORF Transcript_32097/g.83157 Transcript_32097/m.83157 type:complete len:322 (-) Transcript_32097:324-1289(-)